MSGPIPFHSYYRNETYLGWESPAQTEPVEQHLSGIVHGSHFSLQQPMWHFVPWLTQAMQSSLVGGPVDKHWLKRTACDRNSRKGRMWWALN